MRTEARGWMTDYIPFDWQDPFRLDDQIAPEEGAIRDLARDYCQTELQPRIRSAFRNEEFDRSIMTEMGSLGLLGPTLPEEYGGAAANHVAYGLAARAGARVDRGSRPPMSVPAPPGKPPIQSYGFGEES